MIINIYTILLFILSFFILWFFFLKKKTKEKPNNVVLTIKNAENYIEGLILMYLRIIRSRELTQKFHITDLYIIDKGSTDSTPIILEKLTKQYPFIHLVTVSPHKNQTIK